MKFAGICECGICTDYHLEWEDESWGKPVCNQCKEYPRREGIVTISRTEIIDNGKPIGTYIGDGMVELK